MTNRTLNIIAGGTALTWLTSFGWAAHLHNVGSRDFTGPTLLLIAAFVASVFLIAPLADRTR